jgi:predicted porin
MKKSLLALAVLGAFAGAASAQSSVTLFGVVDLSANQIKNGNASTQTLQSNQLNSNRLGFRGIEDLGGGLKAGFWLEAAMNNENGNVGGGNGIPQPTNGAAIFNRRSTVSLFSPWGELRLGRDYNASFWNLVYDDVNGANGLGQGLNLVPGLSSTANSLARVNGTIEYLLPANIGGFYGQAQVSAPSNNASTGNPGTSGQKYYGGRIGYAAGPFDVNFSYGETRLQGFATDPRGDKFKIWNAGGSWDFGIAKIYGFYNEVEFQAFKADTYEISVGVPLGQGEFRAAYAHVDQKGSQANCTVCVNPLPPSQITNLNGDDAQMWSLEYVYNLSKRTAIYTTFGQIDNKGKAAFSVLPGTASDAALAGGKSTGYNLGVRHSF